MPAARLPPGLYERLLSLALDRDIAADARDERRHAVCNRGGRLTAYPGSPALDDHHPFCALGGGKIRSPPSDGAGSNHDQVGAVACHRAIIVRRGRPLTLLDA